MKKFMTILLLLFPAYMFAVDPGVLTGTYPGDTYGGLIHFDGNDGAPAAVPGQIYDGLGNALPMSASQTTISFTGIFTQTQVNAAGGSANPYDYTGTLGIMDGSDDFTLFDINITNANHTGASNTVQAIDIAGITGDADATETAINIGSGWDSGITVQSPVTTGQDANQTGGAGTGGGGATLRVNSNNTTVSALTILDTYNPTTGQTGSAPSIDFSQRYTADGGVSYSSQVMGRIAFEKISDAFHPTATTDNDGKLSFYVRSGGTAGDDFSLAFGINSLSTGYWEVLTPWGFKAGNGFGSTGCTFSSVGVASCDGLITGADGAELYKSAAGSVLTFAGADAAGNWTLIDTSGAGGIGDSSDYIVNTAAQGSWNGAGTLTAPTLIGSTELVIPNGAAPPATCTAGAIFLDTDPDTDTNCATTADNSLCLCVSTNTWAALENN